MPSDMSTWSHPSPRVLAHDLRGSFHNPSTGSHLAVGKALPGDYRGEGEAGWCLGRGVGEQLRYHRTWGHRTPRPSLLRSSGYRILCCNDGKGPVTSSTQRGEGVKGGGGSRKGTGGWEGHEGKSCQTGHLMSRTRRTVQTSTMPTQIGKS